MLSSMNASIFFQGGTLVLRHVEPNASIPPPFQFIKGLWRCEAYHYPSIRPWLQENQVRDDVPRWKRLALNLHETREPHDYQIAALEAWKQHERRGSIVLPTGAGKTFLAIHAIYEVKASTVIIVPTISLVHQWYARLVNAFQTEIGVYYSGEKLLQPITVTTYHSAGDLIAASGNIFRLLIFDEVHHLPARTWGEAALMTPAPCRLGLTATYPEEEEQTNGRWRVDELLGPTVYNLPLRDLVGQQLADYRTERIRVNLTEKERVDYDAAYATYTGFIRERRLRRSHGPHWLRELMRLSAFDIQARQALLARQRLLEITWNCEGKFVVLDELLREHAGERILIFTESNAVAYMISQQWLIPVISHETGVAERKHILDAFQNGTYQVLVTSKVLNEGIDVPAAKIAIVLGGGSNKREYIQRLGRILRKQEEREAVLFEVLVRKTIEEGKAQRRHVRKGDPSRY
ncbi:type III restriction protein res subunit [Ktedonobacter racemifer DSM 44963]|uniref:Type III restriction protein res subunit n=2 Tax=Ktedonobacter racemifer TaxID=363277 RepID=D6U011_KTERA|nr:type III restriction protein res subunit [Ktedonobacter racemifer DSM 44963]